MRMNSRRFLAVLALLLTVALAAAALAETPVAETPVEAPLAETPTPAVVISAPETFELGLSQRLTLPAAIEPDDGSFELKFMSSDSKVCKIALSTGVFKPYAEGTCTVRVYAVPTSKAVTAEPPASVEVAVTVTRAVTLSRVVQTGENTLSLLFTGSAPDIDLTALTLVDENGNPLIITAVIPNPNRGDAVDVTVAEPLQAGANYQANLGGRKADLTGKTAAEVKPLTKPSLVRDFYLTQLRTLGEQTELYTLEPTVTQTVYANVTEDRAPTASPYATVTPTITYPFGNTETPPINTMATVTVTGTGYYTTLVTNYYTVDTNTLFTSAYNTRFETLEPTRTR